MLCLRLHRVPPSGFRADWSDFFGENRRRARERYAPHTTTGIAREVLAFLEAVGPLDDGRRVPLHTELMDQHVYATERAGRVELSGLLDFADARLGPPEYDFGAPVEFLFRTEPGLLRAFLVGYGEPEAALDASYSEKLLAFSLSHRFANLDRLLTAAAPHSPKSLGELARVLFPLGAGAGTRAGVEAD